MWGSVEGRRIEAGSLHRGPCLFSCPHPSLTPVVLTLMAVPPPCTPMRVHHCIPHSHAHTHTHARMHPTHSHAWYVPMVVVVVVHSEDEDPALRYRRGRSGRPLARVKALIRSEGSHVCWLCGQPIPMDVAPNHAYGWTIDHVVPLSLGGDPLDLSNLREAHRTCNSARGKGSPTPPPRNSRRW